MSWDDIGEPDDLVIQIPLPSAEQMIQWHEENPPPPYPITVTSDGGISRWFIAGIDPLTDEPYNNQPRPFSVEWWGVYKDEPTPIYDGLVSERLAGLEEWIETAAIPPEDWPMYARLSTLADRIRRGEVPPWWHWSMDA